MIYMLQAQESRAVKIGWAIDPEARRLELQCGHHEPLAIIRTIDGPRRLESVLRNMFRSVWRRGEWHDFHPDMLTVDAAGALNTRRDSIIDRAVDLAGGSAALAAKLGIKQPSIYSWRRVPPHRAAAIAAITGIPRHELRPDLWQKAKAA